MAIGLVIAPQAVYRAFMRGRYTKNLYQEEFTEGLLSPTVGDLRQRLHLTALLPQPTPSTVSRKFISGILRGQLAVERCICWCPTMKFG